MWDEPNKVALSVDEAVTRYEINLMASKYTKETQKHYTIDVKQFAGYLTKHSIKKIDQVQVAHIKEFLAALEVKKLSNYALYRKQASIKSFFTFLTSAGYLKYNPTTSLIPPERDNPLPRVLTTAEKRRLLASCSNSIRDAAIIELFLETGIRLSELANLNLPDILLLSPTIWLSDAGSVHIAGRGAKKRTIPLSFNAMRVVSAWLKRRPASLTQVVFLNRFGQALNKRSVQNIVDKHLENASIINASVHTLRHTFAVQKLIDGINIQELQRLLGHENSRYTQIYETIAVKLMQQELR